MDVQTTLPELLRNLASYSEDVTDRLTVEWLLSQLTAEEVEIFVLHEIEELKYEEIGKIVGLKYRGRELSASVMCYHNSKIKDKLASFRKEAGY